jgi:diaminohydroxyphosphoribosylaminopyrimidine deaminase/5-amino-6-(5-phosphoribosylamino)uracil reductase
MRITRKRPQVILKLAISPDGKIAAAPGVRTDITGLEVRNRVHLLRAGCDAVLVGMDTVLADDPQLTCRLPGLEERSPRPFVLSRSRELPPNSKLAARGAVVLGGTIHEALAELGKDGINRVLVEGGAKIAKAFLEAGLVDEFQLFQSSNKIGPQGVDALAGLSLKTALSSFVLREEEMLGADRLSVYEVSR